MGHTTEREILGVLKENLRLAAESAEGLARGDRGPLYVNLRASLKLVEGACRQMAGWREDTRWLPFGLKVHEAQQRCGDWLRSREPGWRFQGLAEILRNAIAQATELETKKTGKVGIILPEMQAAPIRTESRPVSMSGLIMPPDMRHESSETETVH